MWTKVEVSRLTTCATFNFDPSPGNEQVPSGTVKSWVGLGDKSQARTCRKCMRQTEQKSDKLEQSVVITSRVVANLKGVTHTPEAATANPH